MSNGTSNTSALAGKRIVIMGGTAGLGLSAAKTFKAAGVVATITEIIDARLQSAKSALDERL